VVLANLFHSNFFGGNPSDEVMTRAHVSGVEHANVAMFGRSATNVIGDEDVGFDE
jgi:hypothetical protein